tara:strand:+ start:92 stop:532 length:441 start_codon:yes stop_codon:yes gene_type:complete
MEKPTGKEWVFLGALGAIIIGIFLPWVSVLGFSVNFIGMAASADASWVAWVLLLMAAAAIGLFFWKKMASAIVAIVSSLLVLGITTIGVVQMGGFTVDAGMLGSINVLQFISIGAYLTMIGYVLALIMAVTVLVGIAKQGSSAPKK